LSSKDEVDLDEIRRHFRQETSKLERWIHQGRIEDYLNTNSGKAEEPSGEIPESSQGDPSSEGEAPKRRPVGLHRGCGGLVSWKVREDGVEGYTCETCGKLILSSGQLEEVPRKP